MRFHRRCPLRRSHRPKPAFRKVILDGDRRSDGRYLEISASSCAEGATWTGGGLAHDDTLHRPRPRPGTDRGHRRHATSCAQRHSAHSTACRAVWLYAPGFLNLVQPPQVAPASGSKLAPNPRSVSIADRTRLDQGAALATGPVASEPARATSWPRTGRIRQV